MSSPPSSESKRSKYYRLGLVGQGQFGQVYCAVHRQTGRLVALKNLEHERFPTHKFLRELRFLLSLQHPNIVTCQALEHTPTGRYLVMDYCEGGTLRTLMTEGMAEGNPLSLSASIKIVADVLAGLEQAHSRGIVHCDIKPENILLHVQPEGWLARISDFGIARLVREVIPQEGDTGSPAYMAPERFYGQYSAASDLYSVGVLLFELIAGYRPFSGTPAELMSAHLNAPLKQPDAIPAVWQPFIAQALQKLPARRFHSAREMLHAIKVIAQQSESTEAGTKPLFRTTTTSPDPLKPLQQLKLPEPITQIAATAMPAANDATPDLTETTFNTYQATGCCLAFQTWADGLLFSDAPPSLPPSLQVQLNAPIEQMIVQGQRCFVVTQRSVWLLPEAANSLAHLHPIAEWPEAGLVAVAPQGTSFATLILLPNQNQMQVWRLVRQQWVKSKPFTLQLPPSELTQPLGLFALDARHFLLVSTPIEPTGATQTNLKLISRRGCCLGEWSLTLKVQQMVPTLNPFQFLALDQQLGTLLVIDFKPYRVRRIGVEISPQFLAAAAWGYVIASAQGTLAFLDQEGQSLGVFQGLEQLTAMTLVKPNGLLLATWNGTQATLSSFDIRTIGLDLIF